MRDGPDVSGINSNSKIAAQTCDTEVWRTMEARARLETEREMMQNQNLIFKPDSVLTYACFDKFASHASMSVGPLFTHTTYFGGKEIIPWGQGKAKGMDIALQETVIASMKAYVEGEKGNFKHALLGGRGAELPNLGQQAVTDIGSKGSTYNCGVMAQVWAAAKCMNFLHTEQFAKNDGFFPFLNLAAQQGGKPVVGYENKNEVRQYPTACGGTPITGSTWKDMYRLSRNEREFGVPDRLYQYGTPINQTYTDVRKLIEPGKCGKQAIKTGVTVILSPSSSTKTMEDGVCTNPGCVVLNGTCVSSEAATAGNYGGRT
ncbi:MAG: hypothetical protein DI626_08450 [Micavibrio aeruginosavorus]|uniref:Uncharacterized protein n=1 Tax=Micavibrio aeruginosavorus TaxID=349221 RepID=A0A2W5BRX7_9BACT|nr:MAG: hypothetical protein DI626_08450 [Micavibrio aeruginosavorus]